MRVKIKGIKEHPASYIGQKATVKGWVRTAREQKTFKICFLLYFSSLISQPLLNPF